MGNAIFLFVLLWGWGIDKKVPDTYDWIGASVCLVGVSIMLWHHVIDTPQGTYMAY